MQRLATSLQQIAADHRRGRNVHQVPVVDVLSVGEVQVVDLLACGVRSAMDVKTENEQRQGPLLVDRRLQERPNFVQRQGSKFLRELPQGRRSQTEEDILPGVLLLEESGCRSSERLVGKASQLRLG